jgi:hypothetical protein
LFALNPTGLPFGGTSCTLSLLGLLLALCGCLLLFALLDGGLASGSASLRTLATALFDDVEGCTDNGALVLHRSARAFLGSFLDNRIKSDYVFHLED